MKVFIACSGSDNVPEKYKILASNVSTFLAKRGHKLVFGGYDHGMMGKCFYTFKYEDGKTKGIASINDADVLDNLEVNAKEITPTTFERTKKIYNSSDLAIILPGGIGTLSEIFSIIDEKRSMGKYYPIILFNYDNYYSPLLNYLKNCYKEGFISASDLKQFDIVNSIEHLEMFIDEIDRNEE